MKTFYIKPIGVIRSEIKNREDAPLFYTEGAPNASLEISPEHVEGLARMQVGDELIVITWLHRADRDVLKVHPRNDETRPLTGVFSTDLQMTRVYRQNFYAMKPQGIRTIC